MLAFKVNRRRSDQVLTPSTLRAARALVDWSREELATRSGTNLDTIRNFETRGSDPRLSTLNKWRRVLIAAGVEFLDPDPMIPGSGPGVRLRSVSRAKR